MWTLPGQAALLCKHLPFQPKPWENTSKVLRYYTSLCIPFLGAAALENADYLSSLCFPLLDIPLMPGWRTDSRTASGGGGSESPGSDPNNSNSNSNTSRGVSRAAWRCYEAWDPFPHSDNKSV